MKTFGVFLLFLALAPLVAAAQIDLNLEYPKFGPFDLDEDQSIGEIIGFFYYFIVGIAGLAAFVMLVWGGVEWLLSGAIPARASEARDRVRNAILGLLLVLASFLIIQIINPELTLVEGLNLSSGECRREDPKDPSSPCEVLEPITRKSGTVTLSATPSNVRPGEPTTLSWSVSGATDCTGDSTPDSSLWTGDKPSSGSETLTMPGPAGVSHIFTLNCFPAGTTQSVNVFVTDDPSSVTPVTVDLTLLIDGVKCESSPGADDDECAMSISGFTSRTFEWTSDGDSCRGLPPLDLYIPNPSPPNGTETDPGVFDEFTVAKDYTYVLECVTVDGSGTDTVVVTVSF